jgi:hypothetical protein
MRGGILLGGWGRLQHTWFLGQHPCLFKPDLIILNIIVLLLIESNSTRKERQGK